MEAIICENLDDIKGNTCLFYEGNLLDDWVLAYFNSQDEQIYLQITNTDDFVKKNLDKIKDVDKKAKIEQFELYYSEIPVCIYDSGKKKIWNNENITMVEFK